MIVYITGRATVNVLADLLAWAVTVCEPAVMEAVRIIVWADPAGPVFELSRLQKVELVPPVGLASAPSTRIWTRPVVLASLSVHSASKVTMIRVAPVGAVTVIDPAAVPRLTIVPEVTLVEPVAFVMS